MNHDVTVAVLRLQNSLMNRRLPHWRAEQTEEALNGLLSRPERVGEPFHLERNAMSDARKKLQRRASLFADHVTDTELMADAGASTRAGGEPVDILHADIVDAISRTGGHADREILAIALAGGGAADVAEALGMTYEVAKVRLSRARQRARETWGPGVMPPRGRGAFPDRTVATGCPGGTRIKVTIRGGRGHDR